MELVPFLLQSAWWASEERVPVLPQTAAESVEEKRLTEENASQSPLVRAGKKGYRHRVRSQSPFFPGRASCCVNLMLIIEYHR